MGILPSRGCVVRRTRCLMCFSVILNFQYFFNLFSKTGELFFPSLSMELVIISLTLDNNIWMAFVKLILFFITTNINFLLSINIIFEEKTVQLNWERTYIPLFIRKVTSMAQTYSFSFFFYKTFWFGSVIIKFAVSITNWISLPRKITFIVMRNGLGILKKHSQIIVSYVSVTKRMLSNIHS